MKHGKMKDKLTKSRNKKTKKAFKLSMGDEDMGAIVKMEKGGIVKMMKGGKVAYKKGGLVEDIQKLEGGGKSKGFPDLTGDGKVTYADILKGRGVK